MVDDFVKHRVVALRLSQQFLSHVEKFPGHIYLKSLLRLVTPSLSFLDRCSYSCLWCVYYNEDF